MIINGQSLQLYGTSASSPAFAGFVSLINSKRLMNGQSSVGWLNPTLWAYPSSYISEDITSGDNNCVAGSPFNAATMCCSIGFSGESLYISEYIFYVSKYVVFYKYIF